MNKTEELLSTPPIELHKIVTKNGVSTVDGKPLLPSIFSVFAGKTKEDLDREELELKAALKELGVDYESELEEDDNEEYLTLD